MGKRLLALNLLLAAASLVFFVQLIRVLSAPSPLPPPSVPPAVKTLTPRTEGLPPAQPSLAAYSVVATKNLFSPNRSEVIAQLAPTATPILHGVVIDGGTRVAYLEDPVTKRVFGYKTGDSVAGGQLEQIEPDRVVIKRPEGPLEVKLVDPSKPKPKTPSITPPASGALPPDAGALPPGRLTGPRGVVVPPPTPQEGGGEKGQN